MACVIIIVPKPQSRKIMEFLGTMDDFMQKQGYKRLDDMPRIYFNETTITPNLVRQHVNMIKNTHGYKENVQTMFFTPSMSKA